MGSEDSKELLDAAAFYRSLVIILEIEIVAGERKYQNNMRNLKPSMMWHSNQRVWLFGCALPI